VFVAGLLSKKRKKIFLVNRDFQLRYTKAAVGVGILSTALTAALILYPLYTFEIIRIAGFLPAPILGGMVVAAVINIAFLALMGIIVTHKIAGPMYSLVRHIRMIGMGQWEELMRQRDGDDLRFVVRNFNEMITELQGMTENDISEMDALIDSLSKLNGCDEQIAQAAAIKNKLKKRITKKDADKGGN
jgi:methyl-accepting chemotaxis protein